MMQVYSLWVNSWAIIELFVAVGRAIGRFGLDSAGVSRFNTQP